MVDRYQSQVRQGSLPNAYMRNYVDGAATGVQVAGAIQQGGEEIRKYAMVQQRRNDEWDAARVMEAQTEYNRVMSDHMDNPETGITNTRKLGAARGVTDEVDKYGDEMAVKISDTLDNDAQRQAFLRIAQRAKIPYWKQGSDFEARQVKTYQDQIFKTTLDQGGMSVQRAPLDNVAFSTAAEQGANAIRSQFYGADPSVINNAISEYTSGLEQQRIAIIAAEDPVAALDMVENSRYLTPGTAASMKKTLGAEVERLEARAAAELEKEQYYTTVDSVWNQYGDDEQGAHDAIYSDSKLSREMQDKAWSGYKSRAYDQKRMEAEVDREYMSAWQDKIADSKSMEEATQFVQESGATGHQRRQMEGYAAQIHGSAQKESLSDWAQAQKEVREGKFKSEADLRYRWGGILSDETMKGLLRTYWSNADKDAGGSGSKNAKYVGYDFDKDIELAKKELKIKEGSPQERVFVTELGDEIFAQEQKLKRPLTPVERGDVLDGLKKRRILNPGILIDDTMPTYEVQRAENMGFRYNAKLGGYYRERPDGSFEKYVRDGTAAPADRNAPPATADNDTKQAAANVGESQNTPEKQSTPLYAMGSGFQSEGAPQSSGAAPYAMGSGQYAPSSPAPQQQPTPPVQETPPPDAEAGSETPEEEVSPAWTTPQPRTAWARSEDTAQQPTGQEPQAVPPESAPRQKRMPDGRIIGERRPAPASGIRNSSGGSTAMSMVSNARRVSSGFTDKRDGGKRQHNATDVSAPEGSEIRSANFGTPLRVAQRSRGKVPGNFVTLTGTTPDGKHMEVTIMHLKNHEGPKAGTIVSPGELIGYVGNTGSTSTGPHMHLQIEIDNKRVDPEKYLASVNRRPQENLAQKRQPSA